MLKLIVSLFEVFGDQSSCEFIDLGSMECENKSVSRSEMSGNPSGLDWLPSLCFSAFCYYKLSKYCETFWGYRNVSLLFFYYTFQNRSNVFGMLNSTRNNSQLQSEKGLLEKILQIKKYITSTYLHVFKAFTMTPKTELRCLLFPLIICQMFL